MLAKAFDEIKDLAIADLKPSDLIKVSEIYLNQSSYDTDRGKAAKLKLGPIISLIRENLDAESFLPEDRITVFNVIQGIVGKPDTPTQIKDYFIDKAAEYYTGIEEAVPETEKSVFVGILLNLQDHHS